MKTRIATSLLLACSVLAASMARAEPLPPNTTTFEAIDSVTAVAQAGSRPIMRVEGLVQGETELREFDLRFSFSGGSTELSARCEKLLLIAQSRPGRYLVVIQQDTSPVIISCKLKSR